MQMLSYRQYGETLINYLAPNEVKGRKNIIMSKIKIKVANVKICKTKSGREFKVFSAVDNQNNWYTIKHPEESPMKVDHCAFIIIDTANINTTKKEAKDQDGNTIFNKNGEICYNREMWINGTFTYEDFPPEDFTDRFDELPD